MEDKLHIITTEAKLEQVSKYILDNIHSVDNICAFDTESTGKCPITSEVIGYSISLFENEGFYIPFSTFTDDKGLATESPYEIPKQGENTDKKMYQCVTDTFKVRAIELLKSLKNYKLIMHNATYDVVICKRNFDIDFTKSTYCDTILLKHTIDCDKPHGLKECGVKYFGDHAKDEQEELGGSVIDNGGKWTMRDKWIWYGDLFYVGKYAAMDTILTLKLYHHLDPELDKYSLRKLFYEDEIMPLLKYATIPMKLTGFNIDAGHFKRSKLDIEAEIDDLTDQINSEVSDILAPMEQRILDKNYPLSRKGTFAEKLILEVGLPLPVHPKTGAFSVAKKVISEWKEKHICKATEDQIKVIWFIADEVDKVPTYLVHKVQRLVWEEKKGGSIINLGSAKQFEEVVGKKWGIKSSAKTKSGDQSFTAAIIERITITRMQEIQGLSLSEAETRFEEYMECDKLPSDADWFIKFLRRKKLEKLVGSFIEGILNLQIEGKIHTNMLQHGTTSGRYASRQVNMQQLPSHSALGMVIKKGFIA